MESTSALITVLDMASVLGSLRGAMIATEAIRKKGCRILTSDIIVYSMSVPAQSLDPHSLRNSQER